MSKIDKDTNVLCKDTISRQDTPTGIIDRPTDTPTDCISRQDAIRIVDGIDTWQAGWRGNATESMKALPSAQPEENCDTCKHGYFGSEMCNNCRVGYPSHYERGDDGVDC